MRCPFCGKIKDKVTDSRRVEGESITKRRRKCLACDGRWVTLEKMVSCGGRKNLRGFECEMA